MTSFDGFCIHRPFEYDEGWKTAAGKWYHLDQNGILKPDKECVQGFLNFYESGLEDGGLVVVPRSHTIFNEIFENRPNLADRDHFINISGDRSIWEGEIQRANLSPIKVCALPGDFVVWDSRTIHCNSPALTYRPLPKNNTILPPRRLVAYVCMTPRDRLTHAIHGRRLNAFKNGHTTSHWPEEAVVASARKNTDGTYVRPELSDELKALIPIQW